MKHTLKAIGLSLALAGSLVAAIPPIASAAETSAKTAIPATLEGVWQAIDSKSADLKKTIDKGALDEVHHHAFAIHDLAAALPEKSTSLSPENLAKVRSGVKFVATLAERLDATGDAKDATGVKQNFDKLKSVLASLRQNYAASK